jgi:membrane associated rhomboid family serine protease
MVLPLGDETATRITPVVTYALIAANVLMFLVQMSRPEAFTMALAATPYEITHLVDLVGDVPLVQPREPGPLVPVDQQEEGVPAIPHSRASIPVLLTLLTSMFLHGGPMHLAGNMLYLWIFGDNVEEVLGHLRYILVYLACGLVGSLAQIMAAPDSMIPTLGASGAIAGVMGAYLIWFPQNRVRVLLFRVIASVPAMLVIGLWIGLQLISGLGSLGSVGETGGVAYLAHIGGAAAGIVSALVFRDRARRVGDAVDTHIGLAGRSGTYYGPRDGRPW